MSGRTGVMMVVGSVRYIPMNRVGEGDGAGNGGGEGSLNGDGVIVEEWKGGIRVQTIWLNEKDRVM